MSEQNDNNEQLNSQDEPQDFVSVVVKGWNGFWGDFCVGNAKLLLGSMASGSMLGLFFALFLSMIITPIMFYVFNSYYPDVNYNCYFKPKDASKTIEVAGKEDQFTIEHCWVNENENAPANDKTESAPAPQGSSDQSAPPFESDVTDVESSAKPAAEVQANDSKNSNANPSVTSNNDVTERQYKVSSAKNGELFSVVITDKNDNKNEKVRKLTIDIKKAKDQTDPEKVMDEIRWFETSNIASSNSIFEVATEYVVMKKASYPTSITAFISWIKDYGKDELELQNISDDNLQKVAAALERAMEDDWEFQNKSQLKLLFARCINGSIQFLCVLLFNAILILLMVRNLVVLYFSPLHRRFEKKIEEEKITTDKSACDRKMIEYYNTWGMESPMLAMWRSALSRDSKDASGAYLTEISERINNTIQSSFSYIMFMSDTIPALGFVGTIIGIGKTMLNTSAVISNELGKQQSRISEVSLDLAFAFDTTLVALLLSMIIGFFITVEMRQEEKHILDIAEDICNQNMNNSNESK